MRKVLCLIASLFISSNLYAKITAEFTPNPTSPGQTVEFILSSDQPFSGTPNLDILKKDFVIGGQQRRQSAQWVNGKGTNIYQLIYTLFPNKSGSLTVQGLKVGNQSIPAATLKVNTTQQQSDPTRSLSMHIDCPQNTIYPAQKMVCTLYLDDPIGIVDGQIIPPQTNLGTWTQVMQPVAVSSRTDGVKRYQSTFSFTPKQSGKLDMPPFVFQGEARLDTRGKMKYDSLLDFMLLGLQSTATQPVSTQTQPFSLNIKHKPATYQGWWLPSPHTTLTESYQMPDTLGVGEPITRTLTLTAQDVAADDMPVPSIKETDTIKVYANPEQRLDTPEGGQVTVTLTLVPTQPGEISLPAAAVSWFNTTTDKI